MPYKISESMEDGIYNFAKSALGQDFNVIWSYPTADRPEKPYLMLNILNIQKIGERDIKRKTTNTYEYIYRKNLTMSANVYSDSLHLFYLEKFLYSFNLPSKYTILTDVGLAYLRHTGPNDLTGLLEAENEYRSQALIYMSYGHIVEETTIEVQKVKVNDIIIEVP